MFSWTLVSLRGCSLATLVHSKKSSVLSLVQVAQKDQFQIWSSITIAFGRLQLLLLTCLLYLIVRVFKTYQVLRHNGLSVTPELLRIVLHSEKHLGKRYSTYVCLITSIDLFSNNVSGIPRTHLKVRVRTSSWVKLVCMSQTCLCNISCKKLLDIHNNQSLCNDYVDHIQIYADCTRSQVYMGMVVRVQTVDTRPFFFCFFFDKQPGYEANAYDTASGPHTGQYWEVRTELLGPSHYCPYTTCMP